MDVTSSPSLFALESRLGKDVEFAICPVAILRIVAAAQDFNVADILRIYLRGRFVAMFVLGIGTPSISQLVWWPPRM